MSSRIAVIALDAANPRKLADFWCAVLDWRILEQEPGIVSIGSSPDAWPTMDIIQVPEGKTVKNRMHLDVRADKTTTENEVQRLLGLGATKADIDQGPNASWVVLRDPEGNEFCVLSLTVQEAE